MVIRGTTRVAGVLGWPVAHSRSPALHNAAYRAAGVDAVYVALPVEPGRLGDALTGLRALGLLGANVTVPHKQEALRLCDELDDAAAAVGAVNTIIPGADGRLRGHDTDVDGFAAALAGAGGSTRASRAVVLGAGGAARAVVHVLRGLGVAGVVVARDVAKGRPLLDLGAADVVPWSTGAFAAALAGADLLVDATATALSADAERGVPAPVDVALLAPGALVCSLVYHREPALLAAARRAGLRTLDGAEMLIDQAAAAFTLMTGKAAPLDAMRAAFREG